MATVLSLPQLSNAMDEGTVLSWRRSEGDTVEQGETLLELMTDKATVEVEAPASGVLRKVLADASATLPVGAPLAVIAAADEDIAALLARLQSAGDVGPTLPATAGAGDALPGARRTGEVAVSPRARRYADAHGIAITPLVGRGTGPGGRVLERDVIALAEGAPAGAAYAASYGAGRLPESGGLTNLAAGLPGSQVHEPRYARAGGARSADQSASAEREASGSVAPLSAMQKRVAENVTASAFSAPHVTLTAEADMTAAAEFRRQLVPELERRHGARLTYNDIFVKAAAIALGEHPRLNSTLTDRGVHLHSACNIGVAVAVEEGLLVPVVRDAHTKKLWEISLELAALVDRARQGTSTPADLTEGTFTVSNLGSFGVDAFTPIITPRQAAILGAGRIANKPAVVDKLVSVRSVMNLCLSFDHRIVDGAPAALFLQRIKGLLENPHAILLADAD